MSVMPVCSNNSVLEGRTAALGDLDQGLIDILTDRPQVLTVEGAGGSLGDGQVHTHTDRDFLGVEMPVSDDQSALLV